MTNNLYNFDNNKIPLEQQICLLKAPDNVKEKVATDSSEIFGTLAVTITGRLTRSFVIIDSSINNHTEVKSNSLIRNSIIGENCIIGPYSRLRSGTKIANNSQIGTFVEIKKSTIGSGCKINHMAFIGDAILGDDVIIGAGSVVLKDIPNNTIAYGVPAIVVS